MTKKEKKIQIALGLLKVRKYKVSVKYSSHRAKPHPYTTYLVQPVSPNIKFFVAGWTEVVVWATGSASAKAKAVVKVKKELGRYAKYCRVGREWLISKNG